MRIIVSGMIAGDPGQGGAAWAVLQYVLGLLQLGHDVYVIEPISGEQRTASPSDFESSKSARYFMDVARMFGLERRCSLLLEASQQTIGLPYTELLEIARSATVLLNISGMLKDQDLIGCIPHRVFLDLDPAFNQLWHATQGIDMRLDAHNRFVTVGKALGDPKCRVPTCGVQWITTFQPVVMKHWPMNEGPYRHRFTTIGNWRGYGSIEHDGIFYGQKAHSLRAFMELPAKSKEQFQLALSIHPGEQRDLEDLKRNGWILLDPAQHVEMPNQYQEFIGASKAEFGIAKSGYVVSRCGWFSDRSACYLASGRPVLAQDTGFSDYLPCGEGLFNFSTVDDALAAIDSINSNYQRHTQAARSIALQYFESDTVLSNLLDAIGVSA